MTGGSSGIGLAIARRFVREGYNIAICGRNRDKLERARESIIGASSGSGNSESGQLGSGQLESGQLAGLPIECLALEADLNDVNQARHVARQAIEHFGRLDVLVNNAASAPLAPFEEISEEVFESTINTNIRSLFYLTQISWAQMKQQGRGVVVNISSLSAVDPFPGFSLYGACKSWLDLMTLSLSQEGEAHGVRVCSIRPGAVETELLRGLFPDFPDDQCVQPDDVASVAWGCVDDPTGYPSGQAFPVPGKDV